MKPLFQVVSFAFCFCASSSGFTAPHFTVTGERAPASTSFTATPQPVVDVTGLPDFNSLMTSAHNTCNAAPRTYPVVYELRNMETLWTNVQGTIYLEQYEIVAHLYDSKCGVEPGFCGCVRSPGYAAWIRKLNAYDTCASNHRPDPKINALWTTYQATTPLDAAVSQELAATGGSANICFAEIYSLTQIQGWIATTEQFSGAYSAICAWPSSRNTAACNKLKGAVLTATGLQNWINGADSTFNNPNALTTLMNSLIQNLNQEKSEAKKIPYPISCGGQPDLSINI